MTGIRERAESLKDERARVLSERIEIQERLGEASGADRVPLVAELQDIDARLGELKREISDANRALQEEEAARTPPSNNKLERRLRSIEAGVRRLTEQAARIEAKIDTMINIQESHDGMG